MPPPPTSSRTSTTAPTHAGSRRRHHWGLHSPATPAATLAGQHTAAGHPRRRRRGRSHRRRGGRLRVGEAAEVLRDPARGRRHQPVRHRYRSGGAGCRRDHARLLHLVPARPVERPRPTSAATARRPRSRRSGSFCRSPFRRPFDARFRRRKQHRVREFRDRLGGDCRRHPRRDRRRPRRPDVRWREIEDHAARLAAGLSAEGIGPGTHVALFLYNCPEYMECLFALLEAARAVGERELPLRGGELAALLENADAEALVFHRSLGERVAPSATGCQAPLLIEIDDGRGVARVGGAGRDRLRRAPRRARAAPAHRAVRRRPAALVHGRHHRPAEGCALAPGHAAQLRRGLSPRA